MKLKLHACAPRGLEWEAQDNGTSPSVQSHHGVVLMQLPMVCERNRGGDQRARDDDGDCLLVHGGNHRKNRIAIIAPSSPFVMPSETKMPATSCRVSLDHPSTVLTRLSISTVSFTTRLTYTAVIDTAAAK